MGPAVAGALFFFHKLPGGRSGGPHQAPSFSFRRRDQQPFRHGNGGRAENRTYIERCVELGEGASSSLFNCPERS